MRKLLPTLLSLLAMLAPASLHAGLIAGSEAFSLTGVTYNYVPASASLLNITDFNSFTLQSSTGNWLNTPTRDPLGNNLSLGVSGLHTASLNAFSFGVTSFGTFQATTSQESSSTLFGQLSRTFFFEGIFTPGTAFTDTFGNAFDPTPVTFTLTFNQSGGAASSISGSATLSAVQDASVTPEPTSMTLAGFAGIGMAVGAWRRRRPQAA